MSHLPKRRNTALIGHYRQDSRFAKTLMNNKSNSHQLWQFIYVPVGRICKLSSELFLKADSSYDVKHSKHHLSNNLPLPPQFLYCSLVIGRWLWTTCLWRHSTNYCCRRYDHCTMHDCMLCSIQLWVLTHLLQHTINIIHLKNRTWKW